MADAFSGLAALQQFQNSRNQNDQAQAELGMKAAMMPLEMAGKLAAVQKMQQEAAMRQQFANPGSFGDTGNMTADALDQRALQMSVIHPEAAGAIARMAQNKRVMEQSGAAMKSMQSQPAPVDGQPQAPSGALSFLVSNADPTISGSAKSLQDRINAGGGGMTQQMVQSHIDNLTRMAASATANKPLTDMAKLNADFAAKRITQPQFDAKMNPMITSGDAKLEGDALREAGIRYATDGTLPSNLGRGTQGPTNTIKVLQAAADYNKEIGNTPEASRISQLANKANTGALNDLSKRESQVSAFEKTFVANTQLVESLSSKVDRTGVPIVNKWLNAGKRSVLGDVDIVNFDAALKGTVNEYTKIVSGSMGNVAMAEQEIKRVDNLLSAAQTPEQIKGVLTTMQTETGNRMKGFSDQKAELMNNFRSLGQRSADKTGASAPASPAAPASAGTLTPAEQAELNSLRTRFKK